jgi:hypothetical protein
VLILVVLTPLLYVVSPSRTDTLLVGVTFLMGYCLVLRALSTIVLCSQHVSSSFKLWEAHLLLLI